MSLHTTEIYHTQSVDGYVGGVLHQNFKHFLEMERNSQGPATDELAELSQAMVEKVIPRLLRPLETGGRHIEPSLVQ